LAYSQFDKPFIIHTDASHTQLGSVICQVKKPIAFIQENQAQLKLDIQQVKESFWL